MNILKLMELYTKERKYEKEVFGDYSKIETLSFPSFLIFLQEYVNKAMSAYSGKWDKELPPWMISCKEHVTSGAAPVKAYEEVIKIMALAGALLETYTDIDPEKWREDLEYHISKWKE